MGKKWMVWLIATICTSAGCAETVPPEWPKECVGRLQLALPGEADQAAYLLKEMIRIQYGRPEAKFSDGEITGWAEFSISMCKTACKTFQISGVISVQKLPPWVV